MSPLGSYSRTQGLNRGPQSNAAFRNPSSPQAVTVPRTRQQGFVPSAVMKSAKYRRGTRPSAGVSTSLLETLFQGFVQPHCQGVSPLPLPLEVKNRP